MEPGMDREARLMLIERMTPALSHDYNNVFGTVSMFAELLLHDPSIEGETADDVREILAAARRGAALTSFMGVIRKPGGANPEPAIVAIELGHVGKILGQLLPDHTVVTPPAEIPEVAVTVDRILLQQAVFSAAWCLAETLPDAGGMLTIDVVAGRTEVEVRISADASEGEVANALDPVLLRGPRDGLESFGGRLDMTSGSRSNQSVAVVLARVPAAPEAAEGKLTRAGGGNVLVVDDPALERVLQAEGFDVTSLSSVRDVPAAADGGKAASALILRATPAGSSFFERVRASGYAGPVIFLAASVDIELRPAATDDPNVVITRWPVPGARLADILREGFD